MRSSVSDGLFCLGHPRQVFLQDDARPITHRFQGNLVDQAPNSFASLRKTPLVTLQSVIKAGHLSQMS
jgi:hypothetical protein